ncbi:hypothetical protein WUBG_07646 [Wuchereria bancrofti]|uniref:Uncharacterized protein n=1 Tax=Wuchereria bancrofti TaxID=6293 RepID=J9EG51_WUCBA|nr:hypothetical protein WUBG_07646 [Wuchereria bancrofti]
MKKVRRNWRKCGIGDINALSKELQLRAEIDWFMEYFTNQRDVSTFGRKHQIPEAEIPEPNSALISSR